jgi:hypothetical protein
MPNHPKILRRRRSQSDAESEGEEDQIPHLDGYGAEDV